MIPCCILAIENDDDKEFMIALYEDYKRLMFFEVGKIVKNEQDIEDVVQDALEKLIDRISLLRRLGRDRLVNYIISTCKHLALNHNRDYVNFQNISYDEYSKCSSSEYNQHGVEHQIIREKESEILRRILARMDSRSRHLLEGYYFLDISMPELAKELGIRPDSVRMALTRARKKAFALLQEEGVVSIFSK